MRKRALRLIITFQSTSDAMAAEKVFREHGFSGRTIPVPRQISASCGLAWSTERSGRTEAEELLKSADVVPEGFYELEVAV